MMMSQVSQATIERKHVLFSCYSYLAFTLLLYFFVSCPRHLELLKGETVQLSLRGIESKRRLVSTWRGWVSSHRSMSCLPFALILCMVTISSSCVRLLLSIS